MRRIIDWWRWVRRMDWDMVDLKGTAYVPGACGMLRASTVGRFPQPIFIETWKDRRTSRIRVHEVY